MEKTKVIMKIESYVHNKGMLLLSAYDYGVRSALKSLVDLCEKKYASYIKLEITPPFPQKNFCPR